LDRDVKKSSIKAVPYSENQLEHSSGFSKLENEYSDLAYEFNWLLKLRCGYKFDSIIAKAANIVKDTCPDTCPCCNSGNKTFEHWLLECPMFNYHRSKYLCLTDTLLNNINLNSNDNLLNDNSYYNRNSNVENRTENYINNSSANNIIDHDNISNLGNNGRINSDNNVKNESNNECNNTKEIVNVTNSDNNENSNRNLDYSNNFISIMTRDSNFNSDESSSNWHGVYYFLFGGKKKFNSIGDREWNDLCKCQLKPGSLTDIPFLVRTSALLNHITPIVSNHLRSLFNRHRITDLTKRVNAENAVRQSNRDSAINNNDNNIFT